MNWYYVDAGQQAGPVTEEQLQELARTGRVQPETLVWRDGLANWQPYREVQTAPPLAAPPPTAGAAPGTEAVCAECGRIFNTQEMIAYGGVQVCAGCKPVFVQKLAEGAQLNLGTLHYAGFWIRFAAKFIDGLILGAVFIAPIVYFAFQSASAGPSGTRFQVLQILAQLAYMVANLAYSIFFLGRFGATPGKMACKLQVVTAEGGKIGYGRATGRSFAEMLSSITCNIGYIIAAFDGQKRTLHDHICSTRVVYKQR